MRLWAVICTLFSINVIISMAATSELELLQVLHSALDDDKNGQISRGETNSYLKEELAESDPVALEQDVNKFHKGDELRSVQDVFDTWLTNPVRKWKTEDVTTWLVNTAHFPEYSAAAANVKADGKFVLRLSIDDNEAFKALGVTSKSHRARLSHLAADIVLFGIPEQSHSLQYGIIFLLTAGLVLVTVLYNQKAAKNQEEIQRLLKKMNNLHDPSQPSPDSTNEPVKNGFSIKLNEGITKIHATHTPLPAVKEDEGKELVIAELKSQIITLQSDIKALELNLDENTKIFVDLTEILLKTYSKEKELLLLKKIAAQNEKQKAKETLISLQKQGIFSFRNSHANEECEEKIRIASLAFEEFNKADKERSERWSSIGRLLGISFSSLAAAADNKQPALHSSPSIRSLNSNKDN